MMEEGFSYFVHWAAQAWIHHNRRQWHSDAVTKANCEGGAFWWKIAAKVILGLEGTRVSLWTAMDHVECNRRRGRKR